MASKSLDGVLTKKANQKETYTNEQVEDLMKCMDLDEGYLYFARKFAFIQHPVKGKLLFDPYEYQLRLMHSYHSYRFNINMMPRQTGKTTCAAIYLAWYAMFSPDQTILIAAHKYTGAQEIMARIRYVYETCPDHIRAGVTSYNKGSIEFENGSRIVSQTTTGNTGRGMSISLLYCDEFAFVQPNIAEEFWTSISPTLATGGRAIITSTPNSDEDTFATIWKQAEQKFDAHGNEQDVGVNGFHSFRAEWQEHPDRDEAWKEAEVAEWQHNQTAIPGQIRVLSDICKYIADQTKNPNGIYWSVENNGIGEAALIVINDFGEENIPGLFVSEPMRKGHVRKFRKGFNTTHSTKITACSRLKTMIENDKMIIHSKPLLSELKGFVATGSSFQAKSGMTDDLVSAALLAIRMMSVLKDWDPRVYNTFNQADYEEDYETPMPIFISTY